MVKDVGSKGKERTRDGGRKKGEKKLDKTGSKKKGILEIKKTIEN